MRIFITGVGGLIGSTLAEVANKIGHKVTGCDSNERGRWFKGGDVMWRMEELLRRGIEVVKGDFRLMLRMAKDADLVVHCAAQPSHDLSRSMVIEDSAINYGGTLQLLEYLRTHNQTTFVFISTNKVYGDRINNSRFVKGYKRYLYADYTQGVTHLGVSEIFSIDQSLHTPFGVSKLAADIMTQEYRRCFGMNTVVFRCGCLTGKSGSAVEMQGFLGYLVKCAVAGEHYTIYGHGGYQVRDNIDAEDVASAILAYADVSGDSVYNMGGGPGNSVSPLEVIEYLERRFDLKVDFSFGPERVGDHKWWISDTGKFQADHPSWTRKSVWQVLDEMVKYEMARSQRSGGEPKKADAALSSSDDATKGILVEPSGASSQRPGPGDATG